MRIVLELMTDTVDMADSTEHAWEKIAAKKRAALAEQIPLEYRIPSHLFPSDEQLDITTFPRESGWFTEKELEITESGATHILKKIASKSWSSEDVTRAFCKRAAAAQQLVWSRLGQRNMSLTCRLDQLSDRLLSY